MNLPEKPEFHNPIDNNGRYNDPRRERDCMRYLANIIGKTGMEDGGQGLDTLEGWSYRVAMKLWKQSMLLEAAKHLLLAATGPTDGPTNYEDVLHNWLSEFVGDTC